MTSACPMRRLSLAVAIAAGMGGAAGQVAAAPYVQTDLVSDIPGLAAVTDSDLKNPWGVTYGATSPFWVSNQATNTSTLYSVTGGTNVSKLGLTVSIPTAGAGPQGPTGQVNNPGSGFPVTNGGNGASAHFIFANLNGTISAWNGGTTAFTQTPATGAVYTGLAINAAHDTLYAANAATGKIDVFTSSFTPTTPTGGGFTDPSLPGGLVPFNVQDIGGMVYVTYAPAGRPAQIAAPAGSGAVDVYKEDGTLVARLVTGSQLAAPWGIAFAPSHFGKFSNDLLVANFSYVDSTINAYDPTTGAFLGSIPFSIGSNSPGGLWTILFGNNGMGGSSNVLYVADGINSENDGLFFAIAVPEPAGAAMLGGAALGLLFVRGRRRAAP